MRWSAIALIIVLTAASISHATEARVIKVLPQFLDRRGRDSISPSLYDRDAYQAQLRKKPELRSGLQFAVQWKASSSANQELKIRVELRGTAKGDLPKAAKIETIVKQKGSFSHWATIVLDEKVYQDIGEMTAWRVTLWEGEKLLSEQKSFLW